MPTLPGLLALTQVADGALAVAADERNNALAIQTAMNTLLGELDDGVAGQFLKGVGTTISFDYPPGYQYDYVEQTSATTSTATTAAGAGAIVTGNAITYDGATAVWIEFEVPEAYHSVVNAQIQFELYDGASAIGTLKRIISPATTAGNGVSAKRRLTPAAAAHTYSIRVWSNVGGTATLNANTGGSGVFTPIFLRITKA